MGKLPAAGDFKLDMPGIRGRVVAEPEKAPPPPAAHKAARTSVPPGGKSLTFYPSKDAWLQLRMLSGRLDRPAQDLLLDALDALFRDHNLPPIARPPKEG